MIRSRIVSCGGYLPQKVVTNEDLEKIVDTTSEWIEQRTGIKQRHIAEDDETTVSLAVKACEIALKNANLTAGDIDMVIVGTTTPDLTFPSCAALIQRELGVKPGKIAFDVQAVCSGFVFALTTANCFIATGQAKRALVIGAETLSRIIDWDDRTTCVLFGDGAGAVILEACEGDGTVNDTGILSTHLHTEGQLADILYASGGVSTSGEAGFITMEGKEVFKNAVTRLADVVDETLEHNGITKEDIDWLVPHQANSRIIEATRRKLDLRPDQVIITVQEHGNTSAASIPLALYEGYKNNAFKKGELLLLEAMGGGLTWGACLVRW